MRSSQAHKGRAVLHLCDKLGAGGASIHGVGRLLSWWFPLFEKQGYRPPLDLLDDPRQVLNQLDRFAGLEFEEGQLDSLMLPRAFPTLDENFHDNLALDVRTNRKQAWKDEATTEEIAELNAVMGPELRAFGYGETEVRGLSVWRQLSVRGNKLLMNAARHPWIWPMTGPARRLLKLLGLLVESRQERDSDS